MEDESSELVPVVCLIDDEAEECFLLDEVSGCVDVASLLDEEGCDLSARDVSGELVFSVCLLEAEVVEVRDAFLLDVEDFERVDVISPGCLLDNKVLEVEDGFLLVDRGLEFVDAVSPVCLLVNNGMIVEVDFLVDDESCELLLSRCFADNETDEAELPFQPENGSLELAVVLCQLNEDEWFEFAFAA